MVANSRLGKGLGIPITVVETMLLVFFSRRMRRVRW